MALITKTYTFTAGATIVAAEHNDNFDTIYNEFNGSISNANIDASAAIANSKLNLASIAQAVALTGGLTSSRSTTATASTLTNTGNGPHINFTGDPTVASPTDGDLWFTGSELNFRNGTTTVPLLGNIATGSFSRDVSTATGTQEIDGLTFTPNFLIIFAGNTDLDVASFGATDGTTDICLSNIHNDTATHWRSETGIYIRYQTGNVGASEYLGAHSSFDSDGFTISWTKTGSPTGTLTGTFIAGKLG